MRRPYDEIGHDRIARAQKQMKAMCTMLGLYLDNAEAGTTDTVPHSTLADYVWQLEQNLEAIEKGLDELSEEESARGAK